MKRKLIIISIILAATSVNAQTIKDPIQWNQNTTIDTPISVLIDRVDKDRRIALLANRGATVNLMGLALKLQFQPLNTIQLPPSLGLELLTVQL